MKPATRAGAGAGPDTLEAWLEAWYAPAYRTARLVLSNPSEAEDAVQDAFLRLWRFRDSIPEGPAARAWLYRVVVNSCFSRARSERRQGGPLGRGTGELDLPEAAPGPEEQVADDALASAVRRAVAELPEPLRVPLVLRYFAGLSEREIAIAIGRRQGTVKSRLHEARRRLGTHAALAPALWNEVAQ